MYRTSDLKVSKESGDIPELSASKIALLSNEKRIDISSRIQMLQTLAGYKWVGEASHATHTVKTLDPTEDQKISMELLNSLDLACSFDSLERSGKHYSWVQFAINQPMLDLFTDKNHSFNALEEGAVYGFPVSATLAFAGVIPKKTVKQKSIAEYFMFGVNSEKYYDREVEYAEKVWAHLCELAPELTKEAQIEYEAISKIIAASL